MRRVRQADLGHSWHPRAREEAFADGMVLGRPDGHPFERHFGLPTVAATGSGFLQDGLAAVRHGRS